MTLAIFFKTVTLQTLALNLYGSRPDEEPLPVAAVPALTLRPACLSQFEALTVILKASRFQAGASTNCWGVVVRTGGSRTIGGLEVAAFINKLFGGSGVIVVVEGALLEEGWFGAEQVEQVGIVFGFIKPLHHDHDWLLLELRPWLFDLHLFIVL